MPQPPTGTLTFLFTDIEGSIARWEAQPEAMTLALVRHDSLLRGAIEGRGGHVFKTVGAAFCAVFADAEAALGAALDAQRALGAEDWQTFAPGFAELRVRMALHTGQAEVRGDDYFGPALNRTARLMAAGHGGQVLLSLAVQQLVRDYLPEDVGLRDWGEHRLKDLRHSEHVFQLLAPDLADIPTPPVTAELLAVRDRVQVSEGAATRPLSEAMAGLLVAVRNDDDTDTTVSLSPEQAREIAGRRPADLTAYRLGRIAEWSQPRYRLDGRFVSLTLLIDQGEEAAGGRWAARQDRYDDLDALLASTPDPAIVVLGPPGAGKSTLLRRLELDRSIAALRTEDERDRVTFFIQLNQYKARAGHELADPGDWLAAEWIERFPDLPTLDSLLAEGRLVLLLDALNEMPTASEREHRERVGLWKDWLLRLTQTRPGNRVLFSCRSLDYSAPLSTPALRVPQVQIEALTDAQVEAFLKAYCPLRGTEIWKAIAGTPQLEALRAPFFLALVVEQVEATGDLAEDRAGIFTGFVRQALRREVERDNPLFALEELLSSRDIRRITQWQWKDGYELPERGALFPQLGALAYGMQEAAADGGASQVRLDLDDAMDLLDSETDEDVVKAGLAIAVLDEDPAADELLYRHQLLQEYFAARVLAREPKPEQVDALWRAADVRPAVPEILASMSPADTLPPLPQTGWEETTLLAAAMTSDAEVFIRGLLPHSLVVAGRAAHLPRVRERLSAELLDTLREALVARSRSMEADLRARIACALAVGDLGDPRWERRSGPQGDYLLPPVVELPGGDYPIGADEGVLDPDTTRLNHCHVPRHPVPIAPFALGRFAVTNAEWACFMAGGGYEEERWWAGAGATAWRRGEGTADGQRSGARESLRMVRGSPEILESWRDAGQINEEQYERWRQRLAMSAEAFEAHLAALYPGGRLTEPQLWRDARFNRPTQPVVGVSWYEARAYCAWLAAQTGAPWRLPTEVEREAAARGPEGRRFVYGDAFDPLGGNTLATRLRRPSPVGVFVGGDSPEGISDLAGNSVDWTSSLWGNDPREPAFRYPYDRSDGREAAPAGPDVFRVLRGGAWGINPVSALAAYRLNAHPALRDGVNGFRVLRASSAARAS